MYFDSVPTEDQCYLKKELYQLLKEQEQVFDFVQNAALDGLWYWDLENPEEEWMNPKFWITLGYDPSEMPHKVAAWQSIIFPEDKKTALENVQKHLEKPDFAYDQVVRYRHKDGHTVWIRCRGMAIHNKEGKPVRMIGAHIDITPQKEAELSYFQKHLDIENLVEKVGLVIWEWNYETGENSSINNLGMLLGLGALTKEKLTITDWCDLMHKEDAVKNKVILEAMVSGEQDEFEFVARIRDNEGSWRWIKTKGNVLSRTEKGVAEKISGFHFDVTGEIENAGKYRNDEEKLNFIFESTQLGWWEFDSEKQTISLSKNFINHLGYSVEKVNSFSAQDWFNLIHPSQKEQVVSVLTEALDQTNVFEQEFQLRKASGEYQWILAKGKSGCQNLIVGFIKDISDRKRAEAKLLDTVRLTKLFVTESPVAIAMFDREMRYLAVSNRWYEDYNIEAENIIGCSHYEIFPDVKEDWKAHHQRCLKGEVLRSREDFFPRHNGTNQWITWEIRPWYNDGKEVGGILMFTADITELKENELLLAKYQKMLERTNEIAVIGYWEVDLANDSFYMSKVTKEIHELEDNYTPQRDEVFLFYPQPYRDQLQTAFDHSVKTGEPYDLELPFISAKGNQIWIRTIGVPVMKDDKCLKIEGFIQNIENQKTALLELSLREKQFRQTFDFAANGMAIVGLEGTFIRVNSSLCEIVGYKNEELLKLTFQDITHPDDLEKDLDLVNQLLEGKKGNYHLEKRYFRKTGEIVWVQLSVSLVKDEEGKPLHFLAQINDISARKKAQLHLKESINKLKGIQDASTQVAIIETDLNGTIITFNKGAENLLQYNSRDVIGKRTPLLFHLNSEIHNYLDALSAHDSSLSYSNGLDALFAAAKSGNHETREWTYVRKNGSTFPAIVSISPVKGFHNEITGYLAVTTDITNVKQAEAEVKSLLAVTQEQNDRLLNFAHIVSHNLRSHSGNISMMLDLMFKEKPDLKDDSYFPLLRKAATNLKETIGHLNEVTLINTSLDEKIVEIDLYSCIDNVITNIRGLILDTDAQVNNNVPKGFKVKGINAYMDSIVLNLITNAIKYRSQERQPEITITVDESDEKNVQILFSDNGLGIDLKRYGAKLFGMYKTFHGNKDARGVGLFITKNQIEAMSGTIEVESELNKGTTFKVNLPK